MAWSLVQSASTSATSSQATTATATYATANLTSGTKLIAAVAIATNTSGTVTSVKDAALNSFTLIGRKTTGSSQDTSLWAIDTPAGDVGTKPTITVTASVAANMSILIQEVSGLAVGNTLAAMIDGTLGSNSGNGGSSTGSPSYTSSASSEYLVSAYGDDGGPTTWTKPAALTADTHGVNTNSFADIAIGYGNSTHGAEAGSWALAGSSADWATLLVAFKLSGAGSSVTGVTAAISFAAPAGSVSVSGPVSVTGVTATTSLAAPAGITGIDVVQQVAGATTFDYGLSTVAITTGVGSTLIVLAGWDLSTQPTSAAMPAVKVTDSAGNYWFHAGTSSSGVTGSRSAAWICVNARPVTWVSVSLTTFASSLAYTVLEVANMPAYYSLDVSAANANTSASSLTVSPGSAAQADIAFSVLAAGASGLTAPSTPGGWAALTGVTSGAGSPNPVQIFPFWNSALGSGSTANITYTVAQAVPLSGVTLAISAAPAAPVQPNPNFPTLKVEAAFGFTPGDPSQAPPTDGGAGAGPGWTDITARAISKAGESYIASAMGRQYELSQMEAGELTVAINNQDGAFTPSNSSSPFSPNVVLGTEIRVSAFWASHWYYIGSGWVERWPQEWPDLPQWGMSKMIATDAVAVMSSASMISALSSDMLLDAPYLFIPASEQYTTLVGGLNPVLLAADAQGLLAANISRTNQRAAVYVDGTAATGDTGQATGLLGSSDTGFGTTSISTAPTQPSSGPGVIYTDPALPGPTSASGVSVEFWVIIPAATAATLQPLVFSAYGPASNYGSAKPSLTVRINSFSGATMTITTAAGNTVSAPFNPGPDPQQVVLNITASSIAVYLNGGLAATKSLGATDTTTWSAVVGGCPNYAYEASLGEIGDYTIFNLAVYPYQLPTQRILSHYVTGFSGQQGSDATARMAQILSWANLGIARAGQVEFGNPGVLEDVAQGPAYNLEGQSAADGVNQLVLNESGQAFAAPSGAVVFTHRWALFNQAPVATFGDSTAVSDGEVPYLPAMSYDYDSTYVYNQTQVTQQVGANNTITVTSNDFASQASYFLRSALTQTIQTTSDLDAYSLADWEIAKYSQPELRVKAVTIDSASNPAVAFPVTLAIQQGQAVTANRRPVGGAEISELVIVQKIEHTIGPGLWTTSYQLSPYTPEDAVLELDSTGYDILGENTLP